MKKSTKIIVAILCVVLLGLAVYGIVAMTTKVETQDLSQFKQDAVTGKVDKVRVSNYVAYVYLESKPTKVAYTVVIGSRTSLEEWLDEYNAGTGLADPIEYSFNDPNANSWTSYIVPILGLGLFGVLAFFMLRSLNGGGRQAANFSKSKAQLNANMKTRFSDVAGAEEEKQELAEVVEFLKNPQKFDSVGARIPKGVLLVGPPGTGKTLFAKAVAGEANVPFFSISGSDFVEMFVGVGASRVRDLFEDAKKSQPCIVFIDEIDAVGRQRGGASMGDGHNEREQTLNQLLVQMDGFDANSGIIVIAATNRSDVLDPALLRPGRFDRQIYVNLPDVRGREDIFKVHSRNKPIGPDVDFKILARMTSGFSGADIENLLNEAAILAARNNRSVISMLDINEGINKVVMGPQKKSRIVTEVDKRCTAYHEAGHAIIACRLSHCDPVQEVSIIPRGAAAGYTLTRPDSDDSHVTFAKLVDDIAMMMGGRAAEELVLKDISTGAVGDIQMATTRARKMVTEWGMSKEIGPVYLGGDQGLFIGRDYQTQHSYSETIATKIDEEVYRIVETGHQTALQILTDNRDVMDKMVRLLIDRETIYSEEVQALLDGKEIAEIEADLDKRLDERSGAKKQ